MDYIVNGKHKLNGEISVYGAKNCALALLGATVLTDDDVVLQNCPQIVDVENMLKLLTTMGKKVFRSGDCVTVGGSLNTTQIPSSLAHLLRGAGLLLGSTVSRFGNTFLPATGGCAIGKRPIDIHLDGLRAMSVQVFEGDDGVACKGYPKGCNYRLRFASVGATENLLCAAAMANGQVILQNCALEPEVVALEQMLLQMGADIQGIGSQNLCVKGVGKLHGTTFSVIPDRIVASTYLSCVAACGGSITLTNCNPQDMTALLDIFRQKFEVKCYQNIITMAVEYPPESYGSVVTAPYPGFPTDIQQLFMSLCALSRGGQSTIRERLFENRLLHNARELGKMGAKIAVRGDVATIAGGQLFGAEVSAADLRGGAGLIVAALGAKGQSVVRGAEHLLRGYCDLDNQLRLLGADILLQ